jgi:histone H3/H4
LFKKKIYLIKMAGTKKNVLPSGTKRHQQKKRELKIPKPVIKRLAVHAGVTRLQFGVHKGANEKRMNAHLLHMGTAANSNDRNMKEYINNYVENLLEELLVSASESAHYRKIKTIQEKDVVSAIKSKGYIFTYNYQSNPSTGVGHCNVPHVNPRKPRAPKAPKAPGAAGTPKKAAGTPKKAKRSPKKAKKAKAAASASPKKAKPKKSGKGTKVAKVAKPKSPVPERKSKRERTPTGRLINE